MTPELSSSELQVLKLLARIQHPAGYFGIVARLELRKRVLKEHLGVVLETLVASGLVSYESAPGHRLGVYRISVAGYTLLAQEFAEKQTQKSKPDH